jgi:hypothetical protein
MPEPLVLDAGPGDFRLRFGTRSNAVAGIPVCIPKIEIPQRCFRSPFPEGPPSQDGLKHPN